MKVLEELAKRFNQLYIKPETGASQTRLYRDIVRMGQPYQGELSHFIGSEEDSMTVEKTPVGQVMVVFLKHREDFICLYRIMAKRCEPEPVPDTMGASFIKGFTDWSIIRAHMEEYEKSGGTDTDGEFTRFTSDSGNYRGTMILLTEGAYSAVPHYKTPYREEEWLKISRSIRQYHELTHFICRSLYPAEKYPVWDELLADCIGLVYAIGRYDKKLAQIFLGIEDGRYTGGRLENYMSEKPDETTASHVCKMMDMLEEECIQLQKQGVEGFEMAELLEGKFIKNRLIKLI